MLARPRWLRFPLAAARAARRRQRSRGAARRSLPAIYFPARATASSEYEPQVDVRFYVDPEDGEPHIHRHGVLEQEVIDILTRPLEDRTGVEGSRVALGQTSAVTLSRVRCS